jgi:hypothetical protein
MNCKNHPNVEAAARCAGCQESFCSNCLVELNGINYCGSCKTMAVQGKPFAEELTMPCKEASEALKYAIIGIFCFGIILGPMAISKASNAKKMIEDDPRLTGAGKADAAKIIGIVVIVLWSLGLISRFAEM